MLPYPEGMAIWRRLRDDSNCRTRVILHAPLGLPLPMDEALPPRVIMQPICQSDLLDALLYTHSDAYQPTPKHPAAKTDAAVSAPMEQAETASELVTAQASADAKQNPSGNKIKILLAEDNAINQAVIKGMLDRLNCQTSIAQNGEEVLQLWQTDAFDLILMDCHMPVMDGFAATQELRELEAAQNKPRIPIVALTANAMRGDRERCLNVGMDDHLAKPAKSSDLQRTLQQWCNAPIAATSQNTPTTAPGDNTAPPAAPAKPVQPDLAPDAASASEAEHIILDTSALNRLRNEQSGGSIDWLIDLFLGELPGYLKAIRNAYENHDAKALYLSAHKCKGSSANLGAVALINLCAQLEMCGKTGQLEQAETLVKRIDVESQKLKDALEKQKDD
jgi:CheY-like chemotaxis protein/HPt (histidine-containing phosphotransfer) domain-containing protein